MTNQRSKRSAPGLRGRLDTNSAQLSAMTVGLAAALWSAGCGPVSPANGDGGTDGDPGGHVLQRITITPRNHVLEIDLNTPASQAFTAVGGYADNVNEDLTDRVTWSSSNPALGDFTGATLQIPAFTVAAAETTIVTASLGDTDGLAQLTVVGYRMTGPQQDFFFSLPYQDPGGNQTKPLEFSTNVPQLDVFFDMDTTGSMGGTICGLQSSVNTIVIPGVQAQIPNTWFGVGAFEDFPVSDYGEDPCDYGAVGGPDQPFEMFQAITANAAAVQTGVDGLAPGGACDPIGCGNDGAESMVESLYQIATGEGLTSPAPTNVPANSNGVGGVEFRADSMPVAVPITDIYSHNGISPAYDYTDTGVTAVAHTRAQTVAALNAICAKVVGVATVSGDADMIAMAIDTGALVPPLAWGPVGTRPGNCAEGQCCTGISGAGRAPLPTDYVVEAARGMCPLAFLHSGGTGLGDTIVTGLKMLTRFAKFDVVTEVIGETQGINGETLPPDTTTADFIITITPVSFVKPADPPGLPDPIIDLDIMGFRGVTPGTVVSFEVTAFNDFVPAAGTAQFFEATIRVLAGGCTPLDERKVLILVPPGAIG